MNRFVRWAVSQSACATIIKTKGEEEILVLFKETFYRPNIGIYFLGSFDCVDSVGKFESLFFSNLSPYVPKSPAKCTRHAVSIHERRGKSKDSALPGSGNREAGNEGF